MYFRSRKKLQGEVSLSDSIETDEDGNDLMLMDVVGVDDTMLSDLQDREDSVLVRRLVRECLTDREREIVTLRYGLGGRMPRTQREIAKKLGISRSYVSRIEKRALEKARRSHRRARLTPCNSAPALGAKRLKILPVGRTVPCTISALTSAEQTSRARL